MALKLDGNRRLKHFTIFHENFSWGFLCYRFARFPRDIFHRNEYFIAQKQYIVPQSAINPTIQFVLLWKLRKKSEIDFFPLLPSIPVENIFENASISFKLNDEMQNIMKRLSTGAFLLCLSD